MNITLEPGEYLRGAPFDDEASALETEPTEPPALSAHYLLLEQWQEYCRPFWHAVQDECAEMGASREEY